MGQVLYTKMDCFRFWQFELSGANRAIIFHFAFQFLLSLAIKLIGPGLRFLGDHAVALRFLLRLLFAQTSLFSS